MREATQTQSGEISLKFMEKDKVESRRLIQIINSIRGRSYNSGSRLWTIPKTQDNIDKIQTAGFTLCPLLSMKEGGAKLGIPQRIKQLKGLRDYQRKGIAAIEGFGNRALLGDEQGLGKTVQSLCWLKVNPKLRPAICIVTAPMKIQWEVECKEWAKEEAYICFGRNTGSDYGGQGIVIINYEILADNLQWLLRLEAKAIIADEVQYVSNSDKIWIEEDGEEKLVYEVQRTGAFIKLCRRAGAILPMSGTPVSKKPSQFFTVLNLLRPDIFPSRGKFLERYCDPKHDGFQWNYNGASNVGELNKLLLNYVMIRRLKKDHLKELPEKQVTAIPLIIDNYDHYEMIKNDEIRLNVREKLGGGLVKNMKLRKAAALGKVKQIRQYIHDFLSTGEKAILVFRSREIIDDFYEEFKNVSIIFDGRDTSRQKQEKKEKFTKSKKIQLFLANLKSVKEGHTIVAASTMFFIELGDTPLDHDQTEDRIHRYGQKANSCSYFYFIALDTIEVDLIKRIDRERNAMTKILDGRGFNNYKTLSEQLRGIA